MKIELNIRRYREGSNSGRWIEDDIDVEAESIPEWIKIEIRSNNAEDILEDLRNLFKTGKLKKHLRKELVEIEKESK